MKYFNSPFAASGDKIDIPNANQADGSVSFVQGFGFDYERENTDPNYKPVPREQTNSLYHDITEALQYVQSGRSFPYNQDFANAIGGYGKGSLVSLESDLSVVYKSKVDNNLTPPPSANWEVAGTVAQATESVAGIAKIATLAESDAGLSDQVFITPKKTKPSLSGSAVLTGSNNNISLTGIVASLGIEKGDVIRVVAGAYNKLHSVESLTNADNVVVNYEHCGSRGNGPLKLPDYTGNVTVTRIAKWYIATNGIGQDWVNVTSFRATAVDSYNSTGRKIEVNVSSTVSTGNFSFFVNGGVIATITESAGNNDCFTGMSIPPSASYKTDYQSIINWSELR